MRIPCYNFTMKQVEKFGENLRDIRIRKGYTQAQLGKVSGLSRRIISHYETLAKCPSIEKVNKIAEALNVSLNDILSTDAPIKKSKSEDVSYKILKKVRIIEELPLRDQNAIFQHINTVVQRHKLKEEIKHKK